MGVGRGDSAEFPPGWVQLPGATEVEWVKQLVAEQLRSVKDKRGFARQEWTKLRDRNEALDCAVLARAALWLLGADHYSDRFWARLRVEVANASLTVTAAPATSPPPAAVPLAAVSRPLRPRSWLAARGSWLRR